MAYTALYRKFRPDTFRDVKGQEAIITTLENQILSGRIGHAYLFCGTRGCGKTTVAKIMARAVNCEHPTEFGPCGECATCRAIENGTSMNVIEIDAASNNGVDNVREIREEVSYAPTEGKYKVYIIDEVHMLSGSAFNALLKTLEEPPAYVVFILATTEPHKLPATILSRCQRYDFKRISMETIEKRLREVVDAEGIRAEDKALRYIAKRGDGAMRDALSILDRCTSFYLGETLTYEKVLESLGAADETVHSKLFRAVREEQVEEALGILEAAVAEGRDLLQFVNDFTWHIRNLLLADNTSGKKEVPGMEGENVEALREEAAGVSGEQLVRYIRILSELGNEIRFSPQKRILAEVGLIKLCRPQMEADYEGLAVRLAKLEQKLERLLAAPARAEAMQPDAYDPEPGAYDGRPGGGILDRGAAAYMAAAIPEGAGRPGMGNRADGAVPADTGSLPMAVPEEVEAAVRDFRKLTKEASPLLQNMCAAARLSLSKNGKLLMVWPAGSSGPSYVNRHKEELEELIAAKTGTRIHVECEELKETQGFHDLYIDLENKITIPITIEEDE